MPVHSEQRVLPYSATQMYDLVATIEDYPKFLPWCLAARVDRRSETLMFAELLIGFKMVRERFGSRVELSPKTAISVEPTYGPFKRMSNRWHFTDRPEGGCVIDFHVDFQFQSRLLQKIIGALFDEAVRRMVQAFEQRARELYGEPEAAPDSSASR
ncbi:MAG: ubiquinone-binding protein [Rhodospirillaceae bacterium]|nr:ubiquinone-binding protein [Rhodospirillaceae bacterium]|tara:strand:- start:606 stop:1073 length:468 start_codon:yes stop_codon:yes gene_type:complete